MASLYARDSSAGVVLFLLSSTIHSRGGPFGLHVPIKFGNRIQYQPKRIACDTLPCSRFSTEPCLKHPWTEYHKCASS
jgi:hypothetical protein